MFSYVIHYEYYSAKDYSEASGDPSQNSSKKPVSRQADMCCVVAPLTTSSLPTDDLFQSLDVGVKE
jgi:hypothetical protein